MREARRCPYGSHKRAICAIYDAEEDSLSLYLSRGTERLSFVVDRVSDIFIPGAKIFLTPRRENLVARRLLETIKGEEEQVVPVRARGTK